LTNTSSDAEHKEEADNLSFRYPNFQTNQTENSNSQRSFARNNSKNSYLFSSKNFNRSISRIKEFLFGSNDSKSS